MDTHSNQEQNNNTNDLDSKNTSEIKGINSLSIFSKDKKFTFAHQKVEKLVAAVYLLTNTLDHEEPIKWSLRKLGTELLKLNIDLNSNALQSAHEVEKTLTTRIVETVSLLEVASMSGLISEMNFVILKREFFALAHHIETVSQKHSMESMVGAPIPVFVEAESAPSRLETTRNEDRQKSFMSQTGPQMAVSVKEDKVKDENTNAELIIGQPEVTSFKPEKSYGTRSKPLSDFSPVAVKKNRRQSIIINLLKRKKEIMVKDVSQVVQDCSEKTLQRELSELVLQGVLKKEGERRWTKYSLA